MASPGAVTDGDRGAAPYLRVKVCGITRPEDALAAEGAGVDAVGLIFAPGSKRRVSAERAAEVVAVLGPFVTRVGVFVDADAAEVLDLVRALRLDAVQLHGSETPEYARRLTSEVRVVRALRFAPGLTPDDVATYPADAFLLDSPRPGSGVPFAWADAWAWRGFARLILAGGLDPSNVAQAVATLRPYAVDVASGVESRPGVKDGAAISAFVAAARGAADDRFPVGPWPTPGQWSDR